jgi:26S proteasome non-ATPase regulatory subunit 9
LSLTSTIVRTSRARLIVLRNDYKTLMDAIANVVQDHFSNNVPLPESAINVAPRTTETMQDMTFAYIEKVIADSPAAEAGLKSGDRIRKFGYVNHLNHDSLKLVAECCQKNEGVSTRKRQLLVATSYI